MARLNESIANHKIKYKYEYVDKIRKHENGRENNNGGGSAILIRSDLVWSKSKSRSTLKQLAFKLAATTLPFKSSTGITRLANLKLTTHF